MVEEFTGSLLSIDCGDKGVYQGIVAEVDPLGQTVTLENPFHDGTPSNLPRIQLKATDMVGLDVIKLASDFAPATDVRFQRPSRSPIKPPNKLGKPRQNNVATNSSSTQQSSVAVVRPLEKTQPHVEKPMFSKAVEALFQSHNDSSDSYGSSSLANENFLEMSQHGSSGNIGFPHRNGRMPRDAALNAPIDYSQICYDFDFEQNLAMFDKQLVFAEIMAKGGARDEMVTPKKNYMCSENVVKDESRVFITPTKASVVEKYKTDSGISVPAITVEQRQRYFALASKLGYRLNYVAEILSRSAVELCLQIVGGASRLSDCTQPLRVVVLVGADTAQLSIADRILRHLVNRGVFATAFIPRENGLEDLEKHAIKPIQSFPEVAFVRSAKDLPSTRCDIIISCLSPLSISSGKSPQKSPAAPPRHDFSELNEVIAWANDKTAPVFAIEPSPALPPGFGAGPLFGLGPSPRMGQAPVVQQLEIKWALFSVCPLIGAYPNASIYLCDLGISRKLYDEACIQSYVYPFLSKFIIPLFKDK